MVLLASTSLCRENTVWHHRPRENWLMLWSLVSLEVNFKNVKPFLSVGYVVYRTAHLAIITQHCPCGNSPNLCMRRLYGKGQLRARDGTGKVSRRLYESRWSWVVQVGLITRVFKTKWGAERKVRMIQSTDFESEGKVPYAWRS